MKSATYRPTTGFQSFTVAELDGTLFHRTEREDLGFWPCPYGFNEVVFEGFVKSGGGIRHLVHRYDRVTLHGAELDTLQYGMFSRRPYRLAQRCDGSTTSCALALFVRWCRETSRCPSALYRQAYRQKCIPNWVDTLVFADWQGVAYPARWGDAEGAGLRSSLHAVNYHCLASIVANETT